MKESTFQGTVLFIRHCIRGANDAWKRRQFRMAEELRRAARDALDEIDLAIEVAAPTDPETLRRREIARSHAATILRGFGRP